MQEVVAPVEHIKFELEVALEQQLGAQPLPFPGMDKSGAGTCIFFLRSACSKGAACPFRHVSGDKAIVCKHWLRGLCKKGDLCEFLHEYDMSKMPECFFFSKFNACSNKDCPFLHIDPESKVKDCPWYERGFCRHGPACRHRHMRRVMCLNYVCGFCVEGRKCKYMHPSFDVPWQEPAGKVIICHKCGVHGHKSTWCPQLMQPPSSSVSENATTVAKSTESSNFTAPASTMHPMHPPRFHSHYHPARGMYTRFPRGHLRNTEDVTCFKCGEQGHYANRCPKGHLAFLSPALAQSEETQPS